MQSRIRIALAGFALLGTLTTTGCHLDSGNTPSPEAAARAGQRGATGVLDEGDLDRRRVTRFEELLEARVSGVRVRRLANGEFSVQVRGTNTIHGTSQP